MEDQSIHQHPMASYKDRQLIYFSKRLVGNTINFA